MVWTGVTEHRQLLAVAHSVVKQLNDLDERLIHGQSHNYVHTQFSQRCAALGVRLQAVLSLVEADLYGEAFALTRAALEQMLFDRLLFLADRFAVAAKIDDQTWATMQQQRAAGTAWQDVDSWERPSKMVTIIFKGIQSSNSDDVLSRYYFLWRGEYSPFIAHPNDQDELASAFDELEDATDEARRNRDLYEQYMGWSSILQGLQVNRFITDAEKLQYQVHYRFLSAFVHPHTDTRELLYGRDLFAQLPQYDHYSSELALLYAATLAAEQLAHFHAMTTRQPAVGIADWPATAALCQQARAQCTYLWFPGGKPHPYDRFREANRRTVESVDGDKRERRRKVFSAQAVDQAIIPESEIRYYPQPLDRLIAMHYDQQEIATGQTYVSPWPRSDAEHRRT